MILHNALYEILSKHKTSMSGPHIKTFHRDSEFLAISGKILDF